MDKHKQKGVRMNEQAEFRVTVLTNLAELKTGVKAIEEHLERLNGSVVEHAKKIEEQTTAMSAVRTDLELHPFNCELAKRVNAMDIVFTKRNTEEDTSKLTSSKWIEWVKPLIWGVGGIIGYLMISHVEVWLKKLG